MRKADEDSFRPANVAEPVHIFVLHDLPYKLRPTLAESFKRIVDVVHREHDTKVAESVHRRGAMIGDSGWSEKTAKLQPAMTVGRTHHGNLDMLIAQAGDTPSPFAFDRGAPFKLQPELKKEINRCAEVFDDDSHIVHPFDCHTPILQSVDSPNHRQPSQRKLPSWYPHLKVPSLFDQIGGEEACLRLSELFHDRVEHDPDLRRLFGRNFEPQRERLAWYLTQALGGPVAYTTKRGKTSLLCRHAHLKIGPDEIDRWLACMRYALPQMGLPNELENRLSDFFEELAPTLGDSLLPYYSLPIPQLTELLDQDPSLASANVTGRTLLTQAASEWDIERVKLLLKRGAEVHSENLNGHNALYAVTNARHLGRETDGCAVVEALIQGGADVNGVTGTKKVTPLHMSARRGTVEIAKALIAAGASLQAQDSSGCTPLQRAIKCRQTAMIRFLTDMES